MKTADLSDHFPDAQVCESALKSYGGCARFHGRIRTVKCFEDFTFVRHLLSENADGNVLVVDAGGSSRAMLGDMLAQMAVDNGWSGAVINGLIRDSAEINTMPIGVRAMGTIPLRSNRDGRGESDVPVTFAGIRFTPGDYLYADEDGILVSSKPLTLPDDSG